jgi:hypothetical protein
MSNRIKGAKFHGTMMTVENGVKRPDRYIRGIPARDLDHRDIDAMDSETYEQLKGAMTGKDPLYTEIARDKKPAKSAKTTGGKKAASTTKSRKTPAEPTAPKDSGATPNASNADVSTGREAVGVVPNNGVETPPASHV